MKCSVPLCYVYPAMLHYKACAKTRRQKLADIALIVFGLIAAVYTSSQTLKVRRVLWCYLLSMLSLSPFLADARAGPRSRLAVRELRPRRGVIPPPISALLLIAHVVL